MEKFDYKPNSFKYKEEQKRKNAEDTPAPVQSVVQGPVTIKKKSGAKKLFSMLVTEDLPKVKDFVLQDVVVPSIKKAIDDTFTNGIRILLYGEAGRNKNGRTVPGASVTYKDYSSYSKTPSRPAETERTRFEYEDVVFSIRGDAEMVLTRMEEYIDRYGIVSVGTLYELIGKKSNNYCLNNWGWTNLSSAKVARVPDGYSLQLPKPYIID